MASFKKSRSTLGTFKAVCIHNGMLMDCETGEVIPFGKILAEVYGEDNEFTIKTSSKIDDDFEIEGDDLE